MHLQSICKQTKIFTQQKCFIALNLLVVTLCCIILGYSQPQKSYKVTIKISEVNVKGTHVLSSAGTITN